MLKQVVKGFIPLCLMVCGLVVSAPAEEKSKAFSPSHLYIFAGASTIPGRQLYTYWHGSYLNAGGGWEGRIADHFTLGGELSVLIPTSKGYTSNAAILSFGPGLHFARSSNQKLDPFATGGVALLGANGGAGGMVYFGGGVNYWFHSRFGLKLEVRDHVWSPEGSSLHFIGGRVGLCIR